MVPVSQPPKKVVPVFERGKRSCQYLMITLKVVPLYDVNPFNYYCMEADVLRASIPLGVPLVSAIHRTSSETPMKSCHV